MWHVYLINPVLLGVLQYDFWSDMSEIFNLTEPNLIITDS
jgi:hypothetical protein